MLRLSPRGRCGPGTPRSPSSPVPAQLEGPPPPPLPSPCAETPRTHCCEHPTPDLPRSGDSPRGTGTPPAPQHPSWPCSRPRAPQLSTPRCLGGSRGHILQHGRDKVRSRDLPQSHCATICCSRTCKLPIRQRAAPAPTVGGDAAGEGPCWDPPPVSQGALEGQMGLDGGRLRSALGLRLFSGGAVVRQSPRPHSVPGSSRHRRSPVRTPVLVLCPPWQQGQGGTSVWRSPLLSRGQGSPSP